MSHAGQSRDGDAAEAQAALQQMTNGYWVTQVLYVAAKLGIADLLKDGARSLEVLAESSHAHAPSLQRLMRALVGLGVFSQNDAGEYETTSLGRCLVSGAPGALRARAILNGEEWYSGWGGLLQSVRTGDTAFDQIFGMPFFEYIGANAEATVLFNEAMADSTLVAARSVAGAYDFSHSERIVDVGGGTGAFLAGILRANPQARGVLFDQPNVVAGSDGLLASAGVADRCDVVGGDFFETVPDGGDIYLLSWIIHDWDDARSLTILRNCRRAMGHDARLLVIEQLVPPGNDPSLSKLYDLHMLVLSGGRERSEDEYRDLLAASDLSLARVIPTGIPRSVIEAERR